MVRKKPTGKKENKSVNKTAYVLIGIIVLLIGIFTEWMAVRELRAYEDSFLDLYGDEQDGYVRVTIDQIKRLSTDASDDAVVDIIESIDTAKNRYWTLSGGEDILFVKSITETSRYKNLTADSYYRITELESFIDSLGDNVIHSILYVNDDRYVVSGSTFFWNGTEYTLCLMTYDHAVLDQNPLLEAKNTILLMVTIIVSIFISVIMLGLIEQWKNKTRILKQEQEKRILNGMIASLNEKLLKYESYTAKYHTYYEKVLPEFLEKLYEKQLSPLRVAICSVRSEKERDEFLDQMMLTMDSTIIRFILADGRVLLLFVGVEESVGKQLVTMVDCPGVTVTGTDSWIYDEITYLEKYKVFIERLENVNAAAETVPGIPAESVPEHEPLHNNQRKSGRNTSSHLGVRLHNTNKKRQFRSIFNFRKSNR